MTQQTDMSEIEIEKVHIIDISTIMKERLAYINIKPDNIINNSDIKDFLAIYPQAKINDQHADLIFAVLTPGQCEHISEYLTTWVKNLNPEGLLMVGLLNSNLDVCDLGDFLSYLGLVNTVIDKELLSQKDEVIYVHAWAPSAAKPVSISVNQILQRYRDR